MRCEVIVAPKTALRGSKILEAMIQAAPDAGVECCVTESYRALAPVLMSYGLGHPERRRATDAHVRGGGRLIGWDLGYWNRDNPDAAMRLTIDDDHPHRWIEPMPSERWDARGVDLREDFHPEGPIVLCGMGRKARQLMGTRGTEWEMGQLARLRKLGRRIIWRPKRGHEAPLPGCKTGLGPIEDVIRGASLVVCRHSNVAVDACIAGIPVQCEDGAAFALYRRQSNPTREQRLDFLRSLAWWQWQPSEAVAAWNFIKSRLSA